MAAATIIVLMRCSSITGQQNGAERLIVPKLIEFGWFWDCQQSRPIRTADINAANLLARSSVRRSSREDDIVSKEFVLRDITDLKQEVSLQAERVAWLRGRGLGADIAERQLVELKLTLAHLEHHRAVLHFSLTNAARCGSKACSDVTAV
jgi:hypothetical protein